MCAPAWALLHAGIMRVREMGWLIGVIGMVTVTVTGTAGCGSGGGAGDDDDGGGGGGDLDAAPRGDGGPVIDPSVDGGRPVDPTPLPAQGSIVLTLTADRAAAANAVVSLGVPFPPGTLRDAAQLRVLDGGGTEVASYSASLALWPQDGSQRSVLVAFRATLAMGASASYRVEYGAPRTRDAGTLAANPDGPVSALLPASWYAQSRVIGFQVAASANTAFAVFETEIEGYLTRMSPGWETYGLSCNATSSERTYYDGPHALFQRFIHRASPAAYRRARLESTWYRANELTWHDGRNVAVYSCQTTWNPAAPMDWGVLRRMLGQGMLDDWLLTGDPAALEAVKGLGEAFRRNLDALTSGREITVKVTERNMAWPMMGLASYFAVAQTAEVRSALTRLIDMTVAWQAAGQSGAFEHDVVRPDPDECDRGPRGGSPFMTSLLVDGLMDSYFLTGDARIPGVITRVAAWYQRDAITPGGQSFRYLWNCETEPYADDDTPDLNLLISHVFGAAYYVSSDTRWLDFGDTMARHGLDNIYAGAPKQWSQSTRGFLKYMGYRALGRTP